MPLAQTSPHPIRLWLLEHVCPYWLERIVDPHGGFFESLDQHGQPDELSLKTVLNQARLTYVFSHASVLGGNARMRDAADHGFDFIRRASMLAGAFEGWHRGRRLHGEIVDSTRDTYDQAFVIFAMAWYHRASGSIEALHMAEQAYGFLETHVGDRVHGGFFEEYPSTSKLPRRQNPHMHLLEAALAMHSVTGQKVWLERATRLIGLFATIFFDHATDSLSEYFDAGWRPAAYAPGLLREPGHQFEWVWLLQQYAKQSAGANAGLEELAARLFEFGSQHGLDPSGPLKGIAFDAVSSDGGLVAGSKLLWPQTEYIKACISRFEATGEASYKQAAFAHLQRTRRHFFYEDGANWVNHVSRDGEHLVSGTPSRVLYHLFLAASELMRIEAA